MESWLQCWELLRGCCRSRLVEKDVQQRMKRDRMTRMKITFVDSLPMAKHRIPISYKKTQIHVYAIPLFSSMRLQIMHLVPVTRLLSWPALIYRMAILRACGACALGTVTLSTPSLKLALTLATSMRSGNLKVRSKEPWTRSCCWGCSCGC